MAGENLVKNCEECGGQCKPLPCSARFESSEFYCAKCHKSYPMDIAVAKQYLAYEAQQKGR